MKCLYVLINIMLTAFLIFTAAACCYNNSIMQRNNEKMNAAVVKIQREQKEQASEFRQIKTDTEIILRLATGGDFENGK